jgi:hypothetical protein
MALPAKKPSLKDRFGIHKKFGTKRSLKQKFSSPKAQKPEKVGVKLKKPPLKK